MAVSSIRWMRIAAEGGAIIVSILLAFGIDAWWDGRQRLSEEAELLAGLERELEGNLAVLEARLDSLDANQERLRRFVNASFPGGAPLPADSAWSAVVRPLYRDFGFTLSLGHLEAARASGKLELIRDVELRAALAGLKGYWDGANIPAGDLDEHTRAGQLLLGAHPEVRMGFADTLYNSPLSAGAVQALVSDDRLVGLASARIILTQGYVRGLGQLRTELERTLGLLAAQRTSARDVRSAGSVNSRFTYWAPFLYEQRALRIRTADRSRYSTIADFVGKRVGAVKGMAAERDLLQRAPPGVQIVSTTTLPELYELFDSGRLDAVAEAEYFTLDGRVIPSHGPDIALIDHHDLNPGQREESVFVVRDESTNLLEAVNAFVARTPFPLHLTR